MATLSEDILDEALANGQLDGRAYHPMQQVETMNRLLSQIQHSKSVDSFKLHRDSGLHHCTVLLYCRWLAQKNLIDVIHQRQGGVCIYRSKEQDD